MLPRNRILLADGDIINVETWRGYLSGLDGDVSLATDGAETLGHVERFVPNVVILNTVMPTVSGLDTCRQIKESHATRKMMIMLVAVPTGVRVTMAYHADNRRVKKET